MKFTTHLELQSQTTRLSEGRPCVEDLRVTDGILTLCDPLFQGSYTRVSTGVASLAHNSRTRLGTRFST